VIRPSTQIFGLLTAEADDGWLARLYNTLFGFNGLDAAYVVFAIQPPHVGQVLHGLLQGGRAHHVHVAPSLWMAAAKAQQTHTPFVDAIDERGPRFEHAQRLSSFAGSSTIGLLEEAPPDPRSALLHRAFFELGLRAAPSEIGVETSFEGEALRPVTRSAPEVWLAASWALEPPRRRAWPEQTRLGPPVGLWVQRASDEIARRFGAAPRTPHDLAQALEEPAFRPCQLTDDTFRRAYPHLEGRP
jgi:hypothetical protein